MSRELPARPNLEHLKNQAKDLLPSLQQRDPDAKLADALHAVAREYGFSTWPMLKAHVESLPRRQEPIAAPRPADLFAGTWTANSSKSALSEQNPVHTAKLQLTVAGDSVTIIDVMVDPDGREQQNRNTIQADGREYPSAHGYALMARWRGARVLETFVKKAGEEVGRVTYEVSADGATLTLSAVGRAHDGYPATEQMGVFDRG